ncbi:hypothetical protein AB0L13_45510 [Saccharopolyspora shandongensis]
MTFAEARRFLKGVVELVFTEAELMAFLDGIANHEFDAIAYTE